MTQLLGDEKVLHTCGAFNFLNLFTNAIYAFWNGLLRAHVDILSQAYDKLHSYMLPCFKQYHETFSFMVR